MSLFPLPRALARRDTGCNPFVRYQLMAGFAVIGAIRINMSQLAPQWIEQGRQRLGIMDILQRDLCRHYIVGHRVYRQM